MRDDICQPETACSWVDKLFASKGGKFALTAIWALTMVTVMVTTVVTSYGIGVTIGRMILE